MTYSSFFQISIHIVNPDLQLNLSECLINSSRQNHLKKKKKLQRLLLFWYLTQNRGTQTCISPSDLTVVLHL